MKFNNFLEETRKNTKAAQAIKLADFQKAIENHMETQHFQDIMSLITAASQLGDSSIDLAETMDNIIAIDLDILKGLGFNVRGCYNKSNVFIYSNLSRLASAIVEW